MRIRRTSRRAEGMTEYIVIVSMLMVCAVVGLFRNLSKAADELASTKALCAECPKSQLSEAEADRLDKLRHKKDEADKNPLDPTKALTDAEKKELDGLERRAGAMPGGDGVTDDAGVTRPVSAFDKWLNGLFGPTWRTDSFLSSFLGLFGWFGFA